MSNEIVSKMSNEIVSKDEWDSGRIDLLKRTVCKGATDDEFRLFLGALHELVVNDYNASPFGVPAPE